MKKAARARQLIDKPTNLDKQVEPFQTGKPATTALPFQEAWDAYWFDPQSRAPIVPLQRLVSAVAALWFLANLSHYDFWWGDSGLSAAQFSGQLEAFTEGTFAPQFRLTPLWLTNSFVWIGLWCVLGALLALLCGLNWGGRAIRCALALAVLGMAQRMSWTVGLVEPYLVAMTCYLAIPHSSRTIDWSHRLALRLVQVHTWFLLVAALASQLSYDSWWQGETAWWLAAGGQSTLFQSGWFEGRILLVNFLTHGITLATIVAVGCLWPMASQPSPERTRCGVAAGLVLAAAYGLLADQTLYGCLLASGVWGSAWLCRASR